MKKIRLNRVLPVAIATIRSLWYVATLSATALRTGNVDGEPTPPAPPEDPDASPKAVANALLSTAEAMLVQLDRKPHDFNAWATYVAQERLRLAVRASRGHKLTSAELGLLHGLIAFKQGAERARA